MAEENFDSVEETPVETFDVNYSCLRCGTMFQTLNYLACLKSNVFVDLEYLLKLDLL